MDSPSDNILLLDVRSDTNMSKQTALLITPNPVLFSVIVECHDYCYHTLLLLQSSLALRTSNT